MLLEIEAYKMGNFGGHGRQHLLLDLVNFAFGFRVYLSNLLLDATTSTSTSTDYDISVVRIIWISFSLSF